MTDKQKYEKILNEIRRFRCYVGVYLTNRHLDADFLDARSKAMKLRIKKIVLDL